MHTSIKINYLDVPLRSDERVLRLGYWPESGPGKGPRS